MTISRRGCVASSRSDAARATVAVSAAAPEAGSSAPSASSAGSGVRKRVESTPGTGAVGTIIRSSPRPLASMSASAISRSWSSKPPLASRRPVERLLSTTRASERAEVSPKTPSQALWRVGCAKARTKQTIARMRSASSSHWRMRTRRMDCRSTSRRKRSVEKSTSRGRRKLKRWTRIGMATAASPKRTRGLRNVTRACYRRAGASGEGVQRRGTAVRASGARGRPRKATTPSLFRPVSLAIPPKKRAPPDESDGACSGEDCGLWRRNERAPEAGRISARW